MFIAGIDYSMTCPSICVYDTDTPFAFENCQFHFLTDKKYLVGEVMPNIFGTFLSSKDYANDIQRFTDIAEWAVQCMNRVERVAIEGYSMGSRGRVFNIGENTGILKHLIHKLFPHPLEIYSPKEIKMFAINNSPLDFSGVNKNKIDKEHMYSIFLEETGTDIKTILTPKKSKVDSPVGDIVDSYYICKLLLENVKSVRDNTPKTASD